MYLERWLLTAMGRIWSNSASAEPLFFDRGTNLVYVMWAGMLRVLRQFAIPSATFSLSLSSYLRIKPQKPSGPMPLCGFVESIALMISSEEKVTLGLMTISIGETPSWEGGPPQRPWSSR